jgi:hypothetical protein
MHPRLAELHPRGDAQNGSKIAESGGDAVFFRRWPSASQNLASATQMASPRREEESLLHPRAEAKPALLRQLCRECSCHRTVAGIYDFLSSKVPRSSQNARICIYGPWSWHLASATQILAATSRRQDSILRFLQRLHLRPPFLRRRCPKRPYMAL